jgi:hypothetical protein
LGITLIPGRMRGFPSFKSVQHGDANLPIFAPNAARSAHYFRQLVANNVRGLPLAAAASRAQVTVADNTSTWSDHRDARNACTSRFWGFPKRQYRERKTKKTPEELWAVEKWKSKFRIPTFPQPRQPAAQGRRARTVAHPKVVYTKFLTPPSITVIAILASASYVYFMAAFISKRMLLGADYSSRLFTTVEVNTFATLALSVLAFFRRSPVRPLLVSSIVTTSFAWFLVWANGKPFVSRR